MKLRRDLIVDFDLKALTVMVVNAMAAMIQEFLDTGQQDLFVPDIGTITSPDWAEPKELEALHVSFIYTGNIHAAVIAVSVEVERVSYRHFNVLVNLLEEGYPVLAVYEDFSGPGEASVFVDFDMQSLDFTIPPRS